MGQTFSAILPVVFGDSEVAAGYIYKVESSATGRVYIGSTTNPNLNKRLGEHFASWRAWQEGRYGYVSVFEIIEEGHYFIELVETVRSASKQDLKKREQYYREIYGERCVNIRNAYVHPWVRKAQKRQSTKRHYAKYRAVILAKRRAKPKRSTKCDVCDCWVRCFSRHKHTTKHLTNLVLSE